MYYNASKKTRKDEQKMKKENEIIDKYAQGNPFSVPEGYFENFSEEMMQKLPPQDFSVLEEEKHSTTWQRIRPWFYMAAMFCGLFFMIEFMLEKTSSIKKVDPVEASKEKQKDQYINDVVDYSMIDNYDTYSFLTESE